MATPMQILDAYATVARGGQSIDPRLVRETIDPRTPTPAQVALAHDVVANVPGPPGQLLYARVDLIPDAAGDPVVLELELIEPSLFLGYSEGAPARWADAIARRVLR